MLVVGGHWYHLQLSGGSALQVKVDGSGNCCESGLPRVNRYNRSLEQRPGDGT